MSSPRRGAVCRAAPQLGGQEEAWGQQSAQQVPSSRARSLPGLRPLPRASPWHRPQDWALPRGRTRGHGALGKYFKIRLPFRRSVIRSQCEPLPLSLRSKQRIYKFREGRSAEADGPGHRAQTRGHPGMCRSRPPACLAVCVSSRCGSNCSGRGREAGDPCKELACSTRRCYRGAAASGGISGGSWAFEDR